MTELRNARLAIREVEQYRERAEANERSNSKLRRDLQKRSTMMIWMWVLVAVGLIGGLALGVWMRGLLIELKSPSNQPPAEGVTPPDAQYSVPTIPSATAKSKPTRKQTPNR